MSENSGSGGLAERELVLTRVFNAPPDKVYRAWTEPEWLVQWFAPLPWTTPSAQLDVRVGGANRIVMRSPEGEDFPNEGVYLEVVENERLVITDAYRSGWEPSPEPFMTVVLTFEALGVQTLYNARVRHWTVADRQRHEQMGFYEGWGRCADQLAELLKRM